MKTVKRFFLSVIVLGTIGVFALGSFNSFNINDKTALLKNDLNIKFAKRLDDLTGKVIMGRMAASIPKWDPSKDLRNKKVIQTSSKVIANKNIEKLNIAQVEEKEIPAPAIESTPELSLTGGLYKQNPLKDEKGYSGSARITDGVVEVVNVVFPDGESLVINTREPMIRNVFQYEDSVTREMKSGLAYPIKGGGFMITLTDDSRFSTLRLEFSVAGTDEAAELDTEQSEWSDNGQASENFAINSEDAINDESNDNSSDEFIKDDASSFQAQNGELQEGEEEWSGASENQEVIETTEAVKAGTFSFQFASMN